MAVMELHALRDLDVSGNVDLEGNREQRIGIDSGRTIFEFVMER